MSIDHSSYGKSYGKSYGNIIFQWGNPRFLVLKIHRPRVGHGLPWRCAAERIPSRYPLWPQRNGSLNHGFLGDIWGMELGKVCSARDMKPRCCSLVSQIHRSRVAARRLTSGTQKKHWLPTKLIHPWLPLEPPCSPKSQILIGTVLASLHIPVALVSRPPFGPNQWHSGIVQIRGGLPMTCGCWVAAWFTKQLAGLRSRW